MAIFKPGTEPWRLWASLIARPRPRREAAPATYCIPHFNCPQFLEVCLDSIRRHAKGARILVSDSTSSGEAFNAARSICRKYEAELHPLYGKHGHSWQLWYLFQRVESEVAVFLDQDCVLLQPLEALFRLLKGGIVLAGPRDEIWLDHPHYQQRYGKTVRVRHQPRFVHPSLMVMEASAVRRLCGGLNPFRWSRDLGPEPHPAEGPYALSERIMRDNPAHLLLLDARHAGYGWGSAYLYEGQALAYHNWLSSPYGEASSRGGTDEDWAWTESRRFINDYWNNSVDLKLTSLAESGKL